MHGINIFRALMMAIVSFMIGLAMGMLSPVISSCILFEDEVNDEDD